MMDSDLFNKLPKVDVIEIKPCGEIMLKFKSDDDDYENENNDDSNDDYDALEEKISMLESELSEIEKLYMRNKSRCDIAEQTNLYILFNKCVAIEDYTVVIVTNNSWVVCHQLREAIMKNEHLLSRNCFGSDDINLKNGSKIKFIHPNKTENIKALKFNELFISNNIDYIERKDILDLMFKHTHK